MEDHTGCLDAFTAIVGAVLVVVLWAVLVGNAGTVIYGIVRTF